MNDNRKPIIVAIICVIAAVILLAVGIGFQGQAGGAAKQIVNMLKHLGDPAPGCPADLTEAGTACTLAAHPLSAASFVVPLSVGGVATGIRSIRLG